MTQQSNDMDAVHFPSRIESLPSKRVPGAVPSISGPAERFVVPCVLLMLMLVVVYGNSFRTPFQFDDFANIVENPNVHPDSLSPAELADAVHGRDLTNARISRPVSYLTLALNYAAGGQDPLGYHVVNFAIHALSALMLFFLSYRILCLSAFGAARSKRSLMAAGLLAAALWASHPIQVTAVTYIVQRMAALAGLFCLLSIYSYVEMRTARTSFVRGFYLAACLAFGALAVGSKENAAMLPVNFVLIETFVLGDGSGFTRRMKFFLFGIVFFGVLFASLWFTGFGGILGGYENRPFTVWQRLMTEPRVFIFYLSLLLYPTSDRFTMLHDIPVSTSLLTPWTTLPAIGLTTAFPVIAWMFRRRSPLLSFSLLFFWVNHLIEGTALPLEIVFEHRNYLPSMFLFLPPAMGFVWLMERRSLRDGVSIPCAVLATFLLFAQGHTTYMRNELFASPALFWLDNVRKAPALHRPRHNLGDAYLTHGFEKKGVRLLQAALDSRAAARHTQKYYTHQSLGVYYLSKRETAAALAHFQAAMAVMPESAMAHLNMARAMLAGDGLAAAERYATAALGHASLRAEALLVLARIRLTQKAPEAARALAAAAVKDAPANRGPFFVIGETFRMQNDPVRALRYYRLFSRDFPRNLSVVAAMIEAHAAIGDTDGMKQAVWTLLDSSGGRLADVLAAYDRNANFMGQWRLRCIQGAIKQSIADALKQEPTVRFSQNAP